MSEAQPENNQGLPVPEPDARPPVSPPVQGMAPAWADPSEQPIPVKFENNTEAAGPGGNLEEGARGSMTGTAERIGSAVGNAQRQMRRGLELVRRPAGSHIAAISSEAEERASHIAREGMDRASRLMEGVEEEISDARRLAARKLEEWSNEAEVRFQELRQRLRHGLASSRVRAKELADAYPLQTIAAAAGVCFALGVALRLRRRSHRG